MLFKPYDPSEWANATFGFKQPAGTVRGLEDVEMRSGESPATPSEVWKVQEEGKDNEEGGEKRAMAGGAVARVRRRRQKEWKRGRGRRGSESEDDGALHVNVRENL